MGWDNWIIDATMGYPLCFCPIEGDLDGDFSVVVGMNLLGIRPKGKVVAVIHEGGQEEANAFYEEHKAEIDAVMGASSLPRPDLSSPEK